MSEDVNSPQQGELHVPEIEINPQPTAHLTPIVGTVALQIGSGDNAQNAIVYRTILWSFVAGSVFSLAAFGHAIFKGAASPLTEVKDVWNIFVPLITLALGYVFGKGK